MALVAPKSSKNWTLKSQGFTLLELIITIGILGILATLAIPSYQQHIIKARRTDGQVALFNLANHLEKNFIKHKTYLNTHVPTKTSPEGHYDIKCLEKTQTTYKLAAIPKKPDKLCQVLTLDHLGSRDIITNTPGISARLCWYR